MGTGLRFVGAPEHPGGDTREFHEEIAEDGDALEAAVERDSLQGVAGLRKPLEGIADAQLIAVLDRRRAHHFGEEMRETRTAEVAHLCQRIDTG